MSIKQRLVSWLLDSTAEEAEVAHANFDSIPTEYFDTLEFKEQALDLCEALLLEPMPRRTRIVLSIDRWRLRRQIARLS